MAKVTKTCASCGERYIADDEEESSEVKLCAECFFEQERNYKIIDEFSDADPGL